MPILIERETSDGLDPVFKAYQQLKRLYEAATPGTEFCDCKEDCPCDQYIVLPGTNEGVDFTDANELSELQHWLVEECSKRITGGAV